KEVSGIKRACADLFDGRSMVITKCAEPDPAALDTVRKLTEDLGFGYIVECTAEIHDKKIAYTSQLAHVVSNAYVKDGEMDNCLGFTGGSFQDMTRIAGVDENTWASLYLANGENLCEKISSLIASLADIKGAIEQNDEEALKKILARGRLLFEDGKKFKTNHDIFVRKLR
ncbi:MAG: prephenate dehydrogenase/arogenate dehydrogenase family protein, partial [Clostridia bacterium]|nr:prephenate dehydrogenase/arogenate dehydrogenase family protein [Clostridia bacterium]